MAVFIYVRYLLSPTFFPFILSAWMWWSICDVVMCCELAVVCEDGAYLCYDIIYRTDDDAC
uniref:Uncharacterized protein n=1 Tax=Arundo donax TaxID=35708 RepID=A0A0A9FIB9_ARUDO